MQIGAELLCKSANVGDKFRVAGGDPRSRVAGRQVRGQQGRRAGGPEDWKTQDPTLKGRPGTGKTELKGGSIGIMDDGLGFIHSVLDAVLYAVIDSALHA